MRRLAVATAQLFVSLAAARAVAADPLPSPADVQRSFDTGDWPAVLKQAGQLLSIRSTGIDRSHLWMKKAEAQVQARQFSAAAASFKHAADEPGVRADCADLGIASADLLRRSGRDGYRPDEKDKTAPAYDVVDRAKRPAALAALFAAESADLFGKMDRAKTSVDPRLLLALVQAAAALRPLDRVTQHGTAAADAFERTVTENFIAAGQGWAAATADRVEAIHASADEFITVDVHSATGQHLVPRRRGTTDTERRELADDLAAAQHIAAAYVALSTVVSPDNAVLLAAVKAPVQKVFEEATIVTDDTHRSKAPFEPVIDPARP